MFGKNLKLSELGEGKTFFWVYFGTAYRIQLISDPVPVPGSPGKYLARFAIDENGKISHSVIDFVAKGDRIYWPEDDYLRGPNLIERLRGA
jgi:hypothetical protein